MRDELLDERRPDFLHESHQKQVIAQYCSGLEHKVRTARSRQEAQSLVEGSCRDFHASCPSKIVRSFLSAYAKSLVRKHWGTEP